MKKILPLSILILSFLNSKTQSTWGTKIGQTYYDLQTNGSIGTKIIKTANNEITVCWTDHWDVLTSNFNEPKPSIRGFGYNHYDGNNGWTYGITGECWSDDFGCASSYLGWPQLVYIPNSAYKDELIIGHYPLNITTRTNLGVGNWDQTNILGIDSIYDINSSSYINSGYPKASSYNDNIHLLSSFQGSQISKDSFGVQSPIRYHRSSDGGATWDISNLNLPFDSIDLKIINLDDYDIHSNGNNIAITLGSGYKNDWILCKSTDNGSTWNKTTILNNHNPDSLFYINDQIFGITTTGNNKEVIVDNEGLVHCFSTFTLSDNNDSITYSNFGYENSSLYKKFNAGILYWNENLIEPLLIGQPHYGEDSSNDTSTYNIVGSENYGGYFSNYFCGYPTASFDSSGNIYLIYSSVKEETSYSFPTDTVGYRSLYMNYSLDNGTTWCRTENPINIANDIAFNNSSDTIDEIFPCAVPYSNNGFIDFTWQSSEIPGISVSNPLHPNNNLVDINYYSIDISGLNDCNSTPSSPDCMYADIISYNLCLGDSLFLNGNYYFNSSVISDTLIVPGCDTIETININFHNIAGDTNCNGQIDTLEIAGDINGNGIIDLNEIAGDLNGDGIINNGEIAGDLNGDGIINFSEVEGDLNGDGVLSPEEESTSISTILFNSISIKPNPFNNYLNISFENTNRENVTIEMQDALGRSIKQLNTKNNNINFSTQNLNSGFYYINITTSSGFKTYKLVKN